MKRDSKGRFTKNIKELSIEDKITSYNKLKQGMIVDFYINSYYKISNALIIKDNDNCFALHNDTKAVGRQPCSSLLTLSPETSNLIKLFNAKYGIWLYRYRIYDYDIFIFDYNIIFKGYINTTTNTTNTIPNTNLNTPVIYYKNGDIVLSKGNVILEIHSVNNCGLYIAKTIKESSFSTLFIPHSDIIRKIGVITNN